MKWPKSIMLIRHGVSAYNDLKRQKESDPLYQEFKKEYEKDYRSQKARELAEEVHKKFDLECSDHGTPLLEGNNYGREVGRKLRAENFALPDVIFTSPYKRTLETLEQLMDGWQELQSIKIYEDERIREQDHGLTTLYYDWRVFHIMHPEQKLLYDKEGPYWYRYPQGENVPDVRDRVRDWTKTVTRDFPEKHVLAVTHHLTKLSVIANYERLNAKEFQRLDQEEKPINCGVTLYRGDPNLGKDGKLVLEFYNQKYY